MKKMNTEQCINKGFKGSIEGQEINEAYDKIVDMKIEHQKEKQVEH